MSLVKLLVLLPTLTEEITKALKDNELTIKEIIDIVDSVLKAYLGKGLGDIGIGIKQIDGKVKIEIIF